MIKKLLVAALFFLFLAGLGTCSAQVTFTHVQGTSCTNYPYGSNSITCTLPGNPATADIIAVAANVEANCRTVAVVDGSGNGYTVSPSSPENQYIYNSAAEWMFYLLSAPSNASKTVVFSFSGCSGSPIARMILDEFSVNGGTAVFDLDAKGYAPTGSTVNCTTITPSTSGELLYSGGTASHAIIAPTAGATQGMWTGAAGGITDTVMAEYDLSASGPTTVNYTVNQAGQQEAMIMAFGYQQNPLANTWTWMSGSNTVNAKGVYGTQGVAAATNVPGAREGAISWTDSSGNFWLFGGQGVDSTGASGSLNDLWEFNPTAKTWTWVGGSSTANAQGVYGTQGTASASNIPGSRTDAVSWTDNHGNLWLFGGNTGSSSPSQNLFNDLWEFNPTTKQWTWVNGSNIVGAFGVYGTQGVAAAGNVPGARYGAVTWIDNSGNLWLFGGNGYDSTGAIGSLNDLWRYQH
jgi:hypothetical protein